MALDSLSTSSGTLLHWLIFPSISSSSRAQKYAYLSHLWIREKIHSIPSAFLWDNLCERLTYIYCLLFLISYSLSLHSFLHLRNNCPKCMNDVWDQSPGFPLYLWPNLPSLLQSLFFLCFALNATVCPHGSVTRQISLFSYHIPWLYLSRFMSLTIKSVISSPEYIPNRLLGTTYSKHPNLLSPKES